jgi:Tfp pilus assembly protein PilE
MKTRKAFTVLELILCIVFVGIFVVLFFFQKNTVDAMDRDDQRKTAINAMYYALEEGYYEENGYYPEKIDKAETLRWIDPNLFTDPWGINLWQEGGDYKYEASDCKDGKCKQYTLRAEMEKEEDYVKSNRH